ncbi:DF family (seleno)protein [Paraconexibacter antarcticus]|uniref:DF family (seleno)protein n=1 Tax=Paraconexibacter antarcticus TaxID=2949664 RepID=UPI003F587EA8
MRVELLYFDGCPGAEALLPELHQMIADADPAGVLSACAVESHEEADRLRFLGSPTVRVDGEDVEPGAADRRDYGMKCRLYRLDGVQLRVPPEKWIRAALRRSIDGRGPNDRPTPAQSA